MVRVYVHTYMLPVTIAQYIMGKILCNMQDSLIIMCNDPRIHC